MAPNQNLYTIGINLKKRLYEVKSVADLISVRQQYFIWRDDIHQLAQLAPFFGKFLRIDSASSDFGINGGVGEDIHGERAIKFISLLKGDIDQTLDLLEKFPLSLKANYDSQSKSLRFENLTIKITDRAESRETELLNVLFSNPSKTWAMDEIKESLTPSSTRPAKEESRDYPQNAYYHAALKINDKVSKNIQGPPLLEVTTKEIKIDRVYL